jgi:hypothetical protein
MLRDDICNCSPQIPWVRLALPRETILTDIPQMDAGSSQVCDILGFPASLERRQQARDGCWDMPKGSGAPEMRILSSSRRTSPVVFD